LTAPDAVTEDTEKTAVFLYSKLKQGARDRRFSWTVADEMLCCNVIPSYFPDTMKCRVGEPDRAKMEPIR